jgi:hypothetical protein
MPLLGADRLGTVGSIADPAGNAGGFFSQLLNRLPDSQSLCFGLSGGVRAKYEAVRSTLSDLDNYSRALGECLRPSFSDFREFKHLLANATVAAAENLRLNTGASRPLPQVYHEGDLERGSAQRIGRDLRNDVVAVHNGTPPDYAALGSLVRDLPGASSTLLSHVREGHYGMNHGIEEGVKGLCLTTMKLLGTMSLVQGSLEMSPLDWNRVKEDCAAFLTAAQHPVLDRRE